MNAWQISSTFSFNYHTRKCFKGCYLNKNIPLNILNEERCLFVVNSLVDVKDIGHWILMYINNRNLFFFDSFGNTPSFYGGDISRIYDLYGYSKSIVFDYPIQSFDSFVCGAYVIYFGYEMCAHANSFLIKNAFTRFRRGNDKKVVRYVDKKMGISDMCCIDFCPRYMYDIPCKTSCNCNK